MEKDGVPRSQPLSLYLGDVLCLSGLWSPAGPQKGRPQAGVTRSEFLSPGSTPGVLVGWLTTAWLCWSQMLCGCCDNDSHSVLEYPPESVSGCISEKLHWSGLTNKKLQFWYKEKSGADVTIQRTWFFPPYLLHQSLQVTFVLRGQDGYFTFSIMSELKMERKCK